VTVRQLESLIRLSEAMARAHCDEVIKPTYVLKIIKTMKEYELAGKENI